MFNTENGKLKIIILILLVLIITSVTFYPSLKNGFVNLDDDVYVTGNENIRSISWENINKIFTSSYFGNYHPVTMLSYLFEYHFFKHEPFGYHITNLILYLLTCILLFWLVYMLQSSLLVAFITTILFSIHPLHVEPVAWISGRKDLLCALFFWGAVISYIYYLRIGRISKYYYFTLFFFILSLLSKPMAVTLPLVLLSTDYLFNRKRNKSMLVDKIPFFVSSFLFSIIAILSQQLVGAIRQEVASSLLSKLMVAGYSIIFYLNKIFIPIKLACLYPRIGIYFSFSFLILPMIFIILVIVMLYCTKHTKYTKKIIFGSAFFLITILPALQFMPISETIVADRHVYIPSLGIFYIIGEGFFWLYMKSPRYLRVIQTLLLMILIWILSVSALLTWKRCEVWRNSLTLWNDVLANYPNSIMAYNNRGITLWARGEYNKAISDFNYVISFVSDVDRRPIYLYLASLHRTVGNKEESMAFYKKAEEIRGKLVQQNYEIANKYLEEGKSSEAINLYNGALVLDPQNLILYDALARAYIIAGRYKEAEALYKRELELSPSVAAIHNSLALVYYYEKQYDLAIRHCDRAIKLGHQVNPEFLSWLRRYRK